MKPSSAQPRRWIAAGAAAVLIAGLAACGSAAQGGPPGAGSGDTPSSNATPPSGAGSAGSGGDASGIPDEVTSDVTIDFWHVYTGEDGTVMDKLLRAFEKDHPHITVKGQFVGNFGDLGKKVVSALQAGAPPDLAIAYPSNVIDYLPSGKLLDLTPYVTDQTVGIDSDFESDVFPIEWSINRYQAADGKYMSFPFTANVMVMYYNEDLLAKAGISEPPATWEQFQQQCDVIKSTLALPCYSANSNASTLDGFAGTFGAEIMTQDGQPAFDSPEWTRMLTVLASLAEKGQVQLTGAGEVTTPDVSTFISQGAPFIFSTNRNVPFIQDAVGTTFAWSAAAPPQEKETDTPTTVLYGPGITAFASGDAQRQLASWLLLKYLATPDAQGIWAGETGNLPIRSSVATNSAYQKRLDDYPATQAAFDLLPDVMWEGSFGDQGVIAVPVPEVRTLLTDAMTNILGSGADVEAVQKALQQGAEAAES